MSEYEGVEWGLSEFEDLTKWARELEELPKPMVEVQSVSIKLRSLALSLSRLEVADGDDDDDDEDDDNKDLDEDDDQKDPDFDHQMADPSERGPPTTPSVVTPAPSQLSPPPPVAFEFNVPAVSRHVHICLLLLTA
jgi:hypothetical protein